MQCKSEPSPLARGTLSEHCSHLVRPRFIPACAGNSSHFQFPNRIWTVHPCLRGELGSVAGLPWKTRGSSPLTRGTRCVLYLTVHRNGFIPAYAGNSETEVRHGSGCTVHPRLRGELDLRFLVIMIVYGSSPLTRGTPNEKILLPCNRRFIPAYAGNSRVEVERTGLKPVHPRLRGELSEGKI